MQGFLHVSPIKAMMGTIDTFGCHRKYKSREILCEIPKGPKKEPHKCYMGTLGSFKEE